MWKRALPRGEVRRRKAPWVQRNAQFFAESRRRRPCSRRAKARLEAVRFSRKRKSGRGWVRAIALALRPARSRVHDTRCPSQSGWGKAHDARKRAARSRRQARADVDSRPLTRDHSASPLREETADRPADRAAGESSRCERAGPGSGDSKVVLADRFDCRSRRVARGTVRPRVKSPRKRRSLALAHAAGAKERRKPISGGKARDTVAGSRSRSVAQAAGRVGNSSREGASGRGNRLF